MYSHDITAILIVLGTAVILPITIVFLTSRRKMQSERNKKEIILAALEKNADINIEELVKKMNRPEKLLKEKLLKKLQWGMLAFFLGIGLIVFGLYLEQHSRTFATAALSLLLCFGIISIISNVLDIVKMKAVFEIKQSAPPLRA